MNNKKGVVVERCPEEVAITLTKAAKMLLDFFIDFTLATDGNCPNKLIYNLTQGLGKLNSIIGIHCLENFIDRDKDHEFLKDWEDLISEFSKDNLHELYGKRVKRKKGEKVH